MIMWEKLVNEISLDMHQVEECYQPTHFWQLGSSLLKNDLEIHGIQNFRSLPSTLGFFVPTYRFNGMATAPEDYQHLSAQCSELASGDKAQMAFDDFLSGNFQARSDYRVYQASDQDYSPYTSNFSESTVGSPIEQFQFNGQRYSRSSLNYLLGLSFIKKHLKDISVATVLEIGGGFGSLGEILLSDSRNNTFYINVDIPPTCIFSSYYLNEVFGKNKVADYLELKKRDRLEIDSLREDYLGAVLCPWQLPDLSGEVDLFVNFISFQEMEPDIVSNYLKHVSRLKSKFVLLRNLREGKQVATSNSEVGVKEPIKGEDYDTYLPDYDLIAVNVLPFGFETIDGFNSELRLYRRKH